MALKQMYDIIESGHSFVDYQISDVGTEQVYLPIRLFYEDGLTIEHIDGDTLLPADYSLVTLESNLSTLFGKDVYKQLYIINPIYQVGMLTINFVGVGDTLNALDVADLQTQINTKLDVLEGGPIEADIIVRNIMPNMVGATGDVSVRDIGSATQKFNAIYADEVFVGASSLYVNGKKVIEDVSDTMTFKTDEDQGLAIKTIASVPGSGNGNLAFQSDNEINLVGKGGIEITVPTGITSKNLTISNAATNGQVLISSVEEVDITAPTIDLNGTVQASNIIVSGNLTVEGTTVTLDTQTLLIKDNIIEINKDQVGTPAESLISGIEVNRGDSLNYRFVFEELTDSFKIGLANTLQAVATREDAPASSGVAFWDSSSSKFNTSNDLTFNGTSLRINSVTDSTNKDTGALIVDGGVGIEKSLNVGGTLKASNFSNDFADYDLTSADYTYTLPAGIGNGFVQDVFWKNGGTYKLTMATSDNSTIGGLTAGTWLGEGEGSMTVIYDSASNDWKVRAYEDSGSNSNGKWKKEKDGILRQYFYGLKSVSALSAYGSMYQGGNTMDYPIEFDATSGYPAVTLGQIRWGTGAPWGVVIATYANYFNLRMFDISSRAASNEYISWSAIGRWRA